MSEEEAIKLLKYKTLMFSNDVYLGESLDKQNIEAIKILLNYIEQLQQENKELKEIYSNLEEKYIKNTICCNEHDCLLYKDYFRVQTILFEFEKWLEEEIKRTNDLINPKKGTKPYGLELDILETTRNRYTDCKLKLQELKEGKK